MDVALSTLFNFYQIPTGRRLLALRQVLEIAEARGDTGIAEAVRRALEINRRARNMEGRWRRDRHRDQMTRREAAEIDKKLDRAVGALHRQLEDVRELFAEEPRGETAETILQHLFPEGAGAIVTMAFEEELGTVQYILGKLEEEWAEDLEQLGVAPTVDRLAELNDEFADALAGPDHEEVSWDQVREAGRDGQEAMLHVVGKIVGEYGTDSRDDIEARRELLGPILEQNERVGELYSRQHQVSDVDPETGEEQPPGEGPEPPSENDGGAGPDQPDDGDGGAGPDQPDDGDGGSDDVSEPDDAPEN
jgi:hypothetical protein